jgi:DNA-binding NarL/FixJ family response regulator
MVDFDDAAGGRVRAVVQYPRRLLLEVLAQWLGATPGFVVAGVTDKPADLAGLCERSQPDVVVLEIAAAGPELTALLGRLRAAAGGRRQAVIGLHEAADPAALARRCDGQVHRMVSVGAGLSTLRAALRDVVAGKPAAGSTGLTGREHEVLVLVCTGCSAVQIGNALGISVHTVVNHKRRIFAKLGVQSRAQAMAEVTRLGLVDRDTMRSAWLLAARMPQGRPVTLTRRERDILASIASGDTVRQTAQDLGIAIKTVQSEQRQLFSRLGATNRAEALILAGGLGLLADTEPAVHGESGPQDTRSIKGFLSA